MEVSYYSFFLQEFVFKQNNISAWGSVLFSYKFGTLVSEGSRAMFSVDIVSTSTVETIHRKLQNTPRKKLLTPRIVPKRCLSKAIVHTPANGWNNVALIAQDRVAFITHEKLNSDEQTKLIGPYNTTTVALQNMITRVQLSLCVKTFPVLICRFAEHFLQSPLSLCTLSRFWNTFQLTKYFVS